MMSAMTWRCCLARDCKTLTSFGRCCSRWSMCRGSSRSARALDRAPPPRLGRWWAASGSSRMENREDIALMHEPALALGLVSFQVAARTHEEPVAGLDRADVIALC